MLKKFYIELPNNYVEFYIFRIYLHILSQLFYDQFVAVQIIIIQNNINKYQNLVKDIIQNYNKNLIFKFESNINKDNMKYMQLTAFHNYENVENILDTPLSYNYDIFAIFFYKILKIQPYLNEIENYNLNKFNTKFIKCKESILKTSNIIILNLSTILDIVLPDMYYIKALAVIMSATKLKSHNIKSFKIIVCGDINITTSAYKLFITNISKKFKHLTTDNFVNYNSLKHYFTNMSDDEIIFHLNRLDYPSICSQNEQDLVPRYLKSHNKKDSNLDSITVFSKELFNNTLIMKSIGI